MGGAGFDCSSEMTAGDTVVSAIARSLGLIASLRGGAGLFAADVGRGFKVTGEVTIGGKTYRQTDMFRGAKPFNIGPLASDHVNLRGHKSTSGKDRSIASYLNDFQSYHHR